MAELYSFGSVDLGMLGLRITSLDGPKAIPPLRGKNIPIASAPGQLWTPHQPDSRRYALGLTLNDPGDGGFLLRQNLKLLAKAFAAPGLQALVRHDSDGVTATAQAQCVAWDPKDVSQVAVVYQATADFELPDPYFYASDSAGNLAPLAVGPVSIPASPTTVDVVSPADVRGHHVVFTFTGPISNPRITNPSNGIWVEVDVTVGAGKLLVIDCGAWTATNDGVNAIGSVRHSGAFPWMFLEPGDNPLSVTSSSPGGSLSLTFDSPYL